MDSGDEMACGLLTYRPEWVPHNHTCDSCDA